MVTLHPFLNQFKEEHATFLEHMAQLQAAGDWPAFFAYSRAVIAQHEKREEQLLFNAIARKAEISAGGPLCMLYYDLHIAHPPLTRAAAVCNQPKWIPKHIDAGSPVCLPIEDHMALEQITTHALVPGRQRRELETLATIYLSILRVHFEKEDNCLFPMSQHLLSTGEMDLLLGAS